MAELLQVPVTQLQLDTNNPRLPERLMGDNIEENEVLNWMLSDATLLDLMASIAENDFFQGEPLIGIRGNDNVIIVVEGNRRLAALKLLQYPERATVSPRTVAELAASAKAQHHIPELLPVYIAANRDEVANYLGFRHVTGVKQWPAISKARYVNSLLQKKGRTDPAIYRELAKEIGSKASQVRRLLLGYQAFERIRDHGFYNIDYLDEDKFDLSLIYDAASVHPSIAEYMGIDADSDVPFANINEEHFEQVVRWLYQKGKDGRPAIGGSRGLPVLAKVLQFEEATKAFLNGAKLIEAAQATDFADDAIRQHLALVYDRLKSVQATLDQFKKPTRDDMEQLQNILSIVDVIDGAVRRKLRSSKMDKLV